MPEIDCRDSSLAVGSRSVSCFVMRPRRRLSFWLAVAPLFIGACGQSPPAQKTDGGSTRAGHSQPLLSARIAQLEKEQARVYRTTIDRDPSEIYQSFRVEAAPGLGVVDSPPRPVSSWLLLELDRLGLEAQRKSLLFAEAVRGRTWPSLRIPVCWESPAQRYEAEKRWVESAIRESWEAASAVRFEGWNACTRGASGIHIAVDNSRRAESYIGTYLDARDGGMSLNFLFTGWKRAQCHGNREACVRAIAVHEFGHALGFVHEQNREEASGLCADILRDGFPGDYDVTIYDPESVMNRCGSQYLKSSQLSELDVEAVQTIYGV